MKIEDITTEALMKATTPELSSLHVRCVQIYCRRFENNTAQRAEFKKHGETVSVIERVTFLDGYGLLKQAMKARGVEVVWNHAIDKEYFRRAVRGLDVPSIADVVVAKAYVSAAGDFIRSPREAAGLEVVVRNETRDEELESKIGAVLKSATGKEPCFVYTEASPTEPHIPIYDLVLRARKETKQIGIEKEKKAEVPKSKPKTKAKKKKTTGSKFDISKPSETNHLCVVGGGKYSRYRSQKRKSNGKPYTVRFGIKADGKSEEYEYFYPKSDWTEAQARKHCKDHDGKKFEAAIAKVELIKADDDKYIKVVFSDVAESRIEETKRDLAGMLWGSIELPGDVVAVYVKTHGSEFYFLHRLEFPTERWTMDKVKKWLEKYGLTPSKSETAESPTLKFSILKIDKKQHIVGGIVYEPNAEDTQGDYTTAPEIQKAMYGFMERYADNTNRIKVMHRGEAFQFPILESFQPEEDTKKGKHVVKAGAWWLMVKVTEPGVWAQIESGELSGFSMGGTAAA